MVVSNQALVLMYHRVVEVPSDPYGLCVRPDRFIRHLRCIRDHSDVVPLAAIQDGSGDRRIAVTFDDGYADNALTAKPILESVESPVTMFIVTGQVGSEKEYWWDTLERIIMEPEATHAPLEVEVGPRITVKLSFVDAAARKRTLWTLQNALMPLRNPAIQGFLQHLAERLSVSVEGRPTHRALSHSELRDLSRSPFVEIGAHSVSHPALPTIPVGERRKEIADSRSVLEDLIDGPVDKFAYPYGEYDRETAELVGEAGLSLAVTCDAERVGAATNPFTIPRYQVCDWEPERFRVQLQRWMSD